MPISRATQKQRFHLVPVAYRDFVLLASNDYPIVNAATPEEAKTAADRWGGSKGIPAMVFVKTDAETAKEEMKTPILSSFTRSESEPSIESTSKE